MFGMVKVYINGVFCFLLPVSSLCRQGLSIQNSGKKKYSGQYNFIFHNSGLASDDSSFCFALSSKFGLKFLDVFTPSNFRSSAFLTRLPFPSINLFMAEEYAFLLLSIVVPTLTRSSVSETNLSYILPASSAILSAFLICFSCFQTLFTVLKVASKVVGETIMIFRSQAKLYNSGSA